ncbi:uncharacterized protein LOC144452481 [Glandiceps talaboti]
MDEKDALNEETPVLRGTDIKKNSISDENTFRTQSPNDFEYLSAPTLLLLTIPWYGINVVYLSLCVVVVPAQIQSMVGQAAKGRWLGGIVAAGAMLTLVLAPLFGMFSDRTVTRFGKRRPMMLVSVAFMCFGLFGMALSGQGVDFEPNTNATCDEDDLLAKRCSPYQNGTQFPLSGTANQNGTAGDVSESVLLEVLHEKLSGNLGLFACFYLISMASLAALHAPCNGLIADKSPPQQRGATSGTMGCMILLGCISGAIVGMFFGKIGVLGTYSIVTMVLLIAVLITVFTISEDVPSVVHKPISWKEAIFEYIEPFRQSDFRWVFFTRFLMQQGIATVTGFLEYWIGDMIILPNCMAPHRAIGIVLLTLLFAATLCSAGAGWLSDKLNKRKCFVCVAALLMSSVSIVFAVIRGEYAFYVVIATSLLFGIGYGSFVAVDFALVLDILPDQKDSAKDIAIWSTALVLPQLLATPIGGILLDSFEYVNCEIGLGYIIVFSVTSVYFLLSGLFVTRISGVN